MTMTNDQLIAELQKYPDNTPVRFMSGTLENFADIECVQPYQPYEDCGTIELHLVEDMS